MLAEQKYRRLSLPRSAPVAAAKLFARPAVSDHQGRRSYPVSLSVPAPGYLPRWQLSSLLSLLPALRTRALLLELVKLSGSISRWAPAAVFPDVHTLMAPCTPATSPPVHAVTAPLPLLLLLLRFLLCRPPHRCSTPPAASLLPHPLAPPLPLPVRLPAPPAAPQSLPAQSGIPAPSPENHSAPQTLSSRPPAISPDPLSGTSALPLPRCTDPAQIAPRSAPAGSDNP